MGTEVAASPEGEGTVVQMVRRLNVCWDEGWCGVLACDKQQLRFKRATVVSVPKRGENGSVIVNTHHLQYNIAANENPESYK